MKWSSETFDQAKTPFKMKVNSTHKIMKKKLTNVGSLYIDSKGLTWQNEITYGRSRILNRIPIRPAITKLRKDPKEILTTFILKSRKIRWNKSSLILF